MKKLIFLIVISVGFIACTKEEDSVAPFQKAAAYQQQAPDISGYYEGRMFYSVTDVCSNMDIRATRKITKLSEFTFTSSWWSNVPIQKDTIQPDNMYGYNISFMNKNDGYCQGYYHEIYWYYTGAGQLSGDTLFEQGKITYTYFIDGIQIKRTTGVWTAKLVYKHKIYGGQS